MQHRRVAKDRRGCFSKQRNSWQTLTPCPQNRYLCQTCNLTGKINDHINCHCTIRNELPVTGASGGAMRSPCERIPAMLETRDPCHKSLRLGRLEKGPNLCASPFRTTLNTYKKKIKKMKAAIQSNKIGNWFTSSTSSWYWVWVAACVFLAYVWMRLNSSDDLSTIYKRKGVCVNNKYKIK